MTDVVLVLQDVDSLVFNRNEVIIEMLSHRVCLSLSRLIIKADGKESVKHLIRLSFHILKRGHSRVEIGIAIDSSSHPVTNVTDSLVSFIGQILASIGLEVRARWWSPR